MILTAVGVGLLVCAAVVELTIRQYQAALPGLRAKMPLLRRLNLALVVLAVLSFLMAVVIPRL